MLGLLLLLATQSLAADCGVGCQAYEWASPLWTMSNVRFGQSSVYSPNGLYTGQPNPNFRMNVFANKIANASATAPAVLCDAQVCGGTPWLLNPAPFIWPNVDTIYKGAFTDLSIPQVLNVPDPHHDPQGFRYYSIVFMNMYTDVDAIVDGTNYPNGGKFCVIKRGTPHAFCDHAVPGSPILELSQYGWALARVYSAGHPATCPTLTGTTTGLDGCITLAQIQLVNLTAAAPLGVFAKYSGLMAPVTQSCGYHYAQPPCGTTGHQNYFWDAVCRLILESPPVGEEAAYVDANFGSLGIHSTGCTALDYATLNQGIPDGWNIVQSTYPLLGVRNQNKQWRFMIFDGHWGASPTDLFQRAVGYAMNPNKVAVYWTTFWDVAEKPLSCADGVTYEVEFQDDVPVNYTIGGFWSITLYDHTMYLNGVNNNRKYAIRGTTPTVPRFTISANCQTDNCLPAPPTGNFHLMFRGYAPLDSLQPKRTGAQGVDEADDVDSTGSKKEYRLPNVKPCNSVKPCN